MAITDADMILIRSEVVNDSGSNGGGMSNAALATAQIVTAIPGNLFPSAGRAERLAGSVKYRKAFLKVNALANDTLSQILAYLDNPTPAGDAVFFIDPEAAGSTTPQTDIQDDVVAFPPEDFVHGCGLLDTSVIGGDSQLVVNIENDDYPPFRINEKVRISDIVANVGNAEVKTITGIAYIGTQATIDLDTPLVNGYAAPASRVMSVCEPVASTIQAVPDNLIVTSGTGTLDVADIAMVNRSAIRQTWTLTLQSSGPDVWEVVGDGVGNIGNIDITVDSEIAPLNPTFGEPYFVIPMAALTGGFAPGDTLVFDTIPAAIPFWFVRVIPPASSDLNNNTARFAVDAETSG